MIIITNVIVITIIVFAMTIMALLIPTFFPFFVNETIINNTITISKYAPIAWDYFCFDYLDYQTYPNCYI